MGQTEIAAPCPDEQTQGAGDADPAGAGERECVVPPKIHAVPLGGLSLLKSAEKLDIRHTHQEKHWFSYAIFQKGCEQL